MAVLKCTSLYTVQRQVFLAKNLLLHGTTAIHGGSEMYIHVHFYLQVCYTNLLLRGTSDIPVRSELLSVSLLKRDDVDTLASAFGNRRCRYKELAENKAQAYL